MEAKIERRKTSVVVTSGGGGWNRGGQGKPVIQKYKADAVQGARDACDDV